MITTLYDKLSSRKYKEYTVCQFPGCSKPLKRLFHQKIRKYCSEEHAKEAQRLYIAEWKRKNKDRVKMWNHRYVVNRRKKIKQGIITKKNENKKS
jgi:hypothetical protein